VKLCTTLVHTVHDDDDDDDGDDEKTLQKYSLKNFQVKVFRYC